MVLADSDGIPRVPPYSGALLCQLSVLHTGLSPSLVLLSNRVLLQIVIHVLESPTTPVCMHTGLGSSRFARRYSGNLFDFFSSDYLDVSVHRVFSPYLEDKVTRRYSCRVAPFGNPWINAYLQLTTAYRSLSRPSSFRNA